MGNSSKTGSSLNCLNKTLTTWNFVFFFLITFWYCSYSSLMLWDSVSPIHRFFNLCDFHFVCAIACVHWGVLVWWWWWSSSFSLTSSYSSSSSSYPHTLRGLWSPVCVFCIGAIAPTLWDVEWSSVAGHFRLIRSKFIYLMCWLDCKIYCHKYLFFFFFWCFIFDPKLVYLSLPCTS